MQPELDHAESEGQPTVLAYAQQRSGASAGHKASESMPQQDMRWEPGFVASRDESARRLRGMPPRHPLPAASRDPPPLKRDPMGEPPREPSQDCSQAPLLTVQKREPAREPPRVESGPPSPFAVGSAGAAVLPSPFAGVGPLAEPEAHPEGTPCTSPSGPNASLPEPNLGFDRNPATPPSEPQSPLTRARSAAAIRAGLPSVKRLRVEANVGRARSFSAGTTRGGARGGLEDRQTWRARARSGELRSLMALHVYEHGVDEIAEVLTDYQ